MRVLFRSGRSGRLFFLPPPRSCNGRLPESRQSLSSARSVRASDPQSLLLIVVFFLFWFDGGTADSCLRASPAGGQDESLADLYRSEEHTSELQSLMRISYAVFCLKKKKKHHIYKNTKKTETTVQ